MKKMKSRIVGCVLSSIFATSVLAASPVATIKSSLSKVLGDAPIEQITATSRAGLYEVVTPHGIVYTDATGSFVIFGGVMVDSRTKANLTEKRMDELSRFDFAKFPFADAIKTVRGNGSRVMATFEDPNCGYCKKLIHEIVKLDNVTVYTFMVSILSPDSEQKAKAIWCAADRSKVWNDFMLNGTALPENTSCETPLARNFELFKKLRLNGTPGIRFANNEKSPGYMPADQIEAKLAKHSNL